MASLSPTLDINTTQTVVDGVQPGQAWAPPRYTTSLVDTVRVNVWSVLMTRERRYKLKQPSGLDWDALLDPLTTNTERATIVRETVLAIPGVDAIVGEPQVSISGSTLTITFTARVGDSTFTMTLGI